MYLAHGDDHHPPSLTPIHPHSTLPTPTKLHLPIKMSAHPQSPKIYLKPSTPTPTPILSTHTKCPPNPTHPKYTSTHPQLPSVTHKKCPPTPTYLKYNSAHTQPPTKNFNWTSPTQNISRLVKFLKIFSQYTLIFFISS